MRLSIRMVPVFAGVLWCAYAMENGTAFAQSPQRVPVYVEHSGKDPAGTAFVHGFREALNTSSLYSLADTRQQSRLLVVIVSVGDSLSRDSFSAISISYVVANDAESFLSAAVRIAGRQAAERIGRELLADLDSVVSDVRDMLARTAPVKR